MELLIPLLIQYPILLFSLCAHEAAHAAMANRCGDPSARLMGRLTLDPRKHIDPLGTVILPLLMLLPIAGAWGGMCFGWAKPVPFNPRNLHNPRTGPVWIALAGPGSNFLLALGAAFAMRVLAVSTGFFENTDVLELLILVCQYLAMLNLSLMLFNMLPVPRSTVIICWAIFCRPKASACWTISDPWASSLQFCWCSSWVCSTAPST